MGDQTYRQNEYQYRDATYSLLDGYNDDITWDGTRPFAVTHSIETLDAPIKPLSSTLNINPLDVAAPALPNLPDPSKIVSNGVQTKDVQVTTGSEQKTKQEVKEVKTTTGANQQTTTSEGILTLESATNFDDGEGFQQAIYATDIQPLTTWDDVKAGWQRFKKSLGDYAADQERIARANIDQIEKENQETSSKLRDYAYQKFGSDGAHDMKTIINHTQDDSPLLRKVFLETLASIMIEGKLDGRELKGIAQHARAARELTGAPQAVQELQFYAAPFIQKFGAEAASVIMDFVPALGSIKSIAEAFKGQDLISGENLSLLGRVFAGVGAIPEVGAAIKNASKVGKYADEVKVMLSLLKLESSNALQKQLVGAIERAKTLRKEKGIAPGCALSNSFMPSTPVRTLSGLIAISALTIGTPVLAFNEETGENGYYPITAVHKNTDADITYLALQDPEQDGKLEYIQTTPEHPFYVKERSDSTARPKPVGHENLNSSWVGAGHLKIGDKIKQADGTVGVVANVVTVAQTQEMFNLTVSEAHTYYVGQDGWLVHNTSCPAGTVWPRLDALAKDPATGKMAYDEATTAMRFEGQTGLSLSRDPSGGFDFMRIGTNGKPVYYDVKGANPNTRFDNKFYSSLNKQVTNARNVDVIVDYSHMNPAQRAATDQFISSHSQSGRFIIVGR